MYHPQPVAGLNNAPIATMPALSMKPTHNLTLAADNTPKSLKQQKSLSTEAPQKIQPDKLLTSEKPNLCEPDKLKTVLSGSSARTDARSDLATSPGKRQDAPEQA